MGTKRTGTSSNNYGERYGIIVNGTDRAHSSGSASAGATSADSASTAWLKTLRREVTRLGQGLEQRQRPAVIDSRRIAALWFSTSLPPPAPVATAATNVQAISFSANWNASSGADGYVLDVATDSGFTSFVSGYEDLDVGRRLDVSVANWPISPSTTYYYRVRAYNGNGTSGNSNTISLTTPAGLMLGNHTLWQVTNRFTTTSPVSDVLFRFNLSRGGTVSVDTLRVNFTTAGGVANADVTSGALYEDTNNNGVIDDGAAIQSGVTPVGGVLTFTTDFTPRRAGRTTWSAPRLRTWLWAIPPPSPWRTPTLTCCRAVSPSCTRSPTRPTAESACRCFTAASARQPRLWQAAPGTG